MTSRYNVADTVGQCSYNCQAGVEDELNLKESGNTIERCLEEGEKPSAKLCAEPDLDIQ